MGEIVRVDSYTTEICIPVECGRHDPAMHEWLALPAADLCPECGSTHFGTLNPRGYFLVRACHDEHGVGCRHRFRSDVTTNMIRDVVGALTGEVRRFGMGAPPHASVREDADTLIVWPYRPVATDG